MPRYYFDIKDRHRLAHSSRHDCENDDAAIERAKAIAIGIALDQPAIDPDRHVAVRNENRAEIFRAPVYSRPFTSDFKGPKT